MSPSMYLLVLMLPTLYAVEQKTWSGKLMRREQTDDEKLQSIAEMRSDGDASANSKGDDQIGIQSRAEMSSAGDASTKTKGDDKVDIQSRANMRSDGGASAQTKGDEDDQINIEFGGEAHGVISNNYLQRPELVKAMRCTEDRCEECTDKGKCFHGSDDGGWGYMEIAVDQGETYKNYSIEVQARCKTDQGEWWIESSGITNGKVSIVVDGHIVVASMPSNDKEELSINGGTGSVVSVVFTPWPNGWRAATKVWIEAYQVDQAVDSCMKGKMCMDIFADPNDMARLGDAEYEVRNDNALQMKCMNGNRMVPQDMTAEEEEVCVKWDECLSRDGGARKTLLKAVLGAGVGASAGGGLSQQEPWTKVTLKSCPERGQRYDTLSEATDACSQIAQCNGVYDVNCDGGYYPCTADWTSSSSSCIYQRPEAVSVSASAGDAPSQAVCAVDSDECIQDVWGSSYTCDSSDEWCTSYAKDMHRCCSETCEVAPPCTVTACNALSGSGECKYPNAALVPTILTAPLSQGQCVDPTIDDPESWACNCAETMTVKCLAADCGGPRLEGCLRREMCNRDIVCDSWKKERCSGPWDPCTDDMALIDTNASKTAQPLPKNMMSAMFLRRSADSAERLVSLGTGAAKDSTSQLDETLDDKEC